MPVSCDQAHAAVGAHVRSSCPPLGVTAETIQLWIDDVLRPWLRVLGAHLAARPYVFGERPSIADFALFGGNAAHYVNDPLCRRWTDEDGPAVVQHTYRLLEPEERGERSYERKLREAILAFRVSREYGKDQILNIYLNENFYGAQAYGVEAAAQTYFSKHVWELTPAEATLIAGLTQSPTTYNPFSDFAAAKARQRVTLGLMAQHGFLTRAEADRIYAEPVALTPPRSDLIAPHFVFYVRDLLWLLAVVALLCAWWFQQGQLAESRRLRAEASGRASGDELHNLANFSDFFSTSECRDLLFHVQEHQFSIPQIAEFLRASGFTFLGFETPARSSYLRRFPEDRAATDLANWAAFEAENPATFAAMYQFWIQKA